MFVMILSNNKCVYELTSRGHVDVRKPLHPGVQFHLPRPLFSATCEMKVIDHMSMRSINDSNSSDFGIRYLWLNSLHPAHDAKKLQDACMHLI